MSGFRALNIESDDESDIEVDDTKELQIEDALKLYQNALRLHAEGPSAYDEAAEAYQELFASEIFSYPESQTELRRLELYGPLTDAEDLELSPETGAVVASSGFDSGPSTLPQILHLSHKNYAQFKLEYLSARLNTLQLDLKHILADASSALGHFVQALDKDDSDLDLWRRTAAVGEVLDSKRVARFCLEAVLDADEEGGRGVSAFPSLEEGLASDQLRELINELDDQFLKIKKAPTAGKRNTLSRLLKQHLRPFPALTTRTKDLRGRPDYDAPQIKQPSRLVLRAPTTWAALGDALLQQYTAVQQGSSVDAPGSAITFDLSGSSTASPELSTREQDNDAMDGVTTDTVATHTVIEVEVSQNLATPPSPQHPVLDRADASADVLKTEEMSVEDTQTMVLPSRKRSGEAAGLNESIEEGRTKSKRLRARDSTLEGGDTRQSIIDANVQWEFEQQLNEIQAADDWMFETVGNLFERIGVVGFEAAREVRQEMQQTSPPQISGTDGGRKAALTKLQTARADLSSFLDKYTDQQARILLHGGEDVESGQASGALGFGGALGNGAHSKPTNNLPAMSEDGLLGLVEETNQNWYLTSGVAYAWLVRLLRPAQGQSDVNSYCQYSWPEHLKTIVVRILVTFDAEIYTLAMQDLAKFRDAASQLTDYGTAHDIDTSLAAMLESIFELHLDIFTLIKQPNSGVDIDTVTTQGDRLQRWSDLAREALHFRAVTRSGRGVEDQISLRFLWATTFTIAAAADVPQSHVLECMNDLRGVLSAAGEPFISLHNNAVMPEVSIAALDREISRLTTKDFFLKVTDQDTNDPVAVIESLEPLLFALDVRDQRGVDQEGVDVAEYEDNVPEELVQYLQNSRMSVRLLLWQRLRDANAAIGYMPMIVLCYFRMMRLVLEGLKSSEYKLQTALERQSATLDTLRLVQDMVTKVLSTIRQNDDALECLDDGDLKSAVSSLGDTLQLLQVFNVFEDSIRVGQTQAPSLETGTATSSFDATTALVHDLQLQIWMVMYALLKEAMYQHHDLFPTPAEDKFDFLRCVHRNLGIRGICGGSNRVFVRMLKDEFCHMTHVEGYDSEQAQVLYDLYGLNCFLNPSYELIEHHCTHDAFLDRGVAAQAVDLLIAQASKIPIRDLVKHTLKDTIEKVHGAIVRKKPTDTVLRNRDVYRAFLKSPINPLDLYSCLKGEGNELPVTPISREDAVLASKGWYFLMGHISLAKYRSQKRTTATPTEDIDIAIAFFMQDLDFGMDNWETWFRLAQAYDTKIEESVVWSAEKLNNNMAEIVQLQRAAIHCYALATALAYRSADLEVETSDKMAELFSDFAARMYASSRDPFGMLPFADESERFMSLDTGMGKKKPFTTLTVYKAWKIAKVLMQRAMMGRPASWTLHFMLGKVLWKMHSSRPDVRQNDRPPTAEAVLSAFTHVIDILPDKKDSREKREPILEPHYKLVSVVHKMVIRGDLSLERARETLAQTPYARLVAFPQEMVGWVPYVLAILKNLRAADKSNWHHRMIARAANIVYKDPSLHADNTTAALRRRATDAKHELTQQMFTKTMVLQVWRPECERAGRHFVYTARYTRLFLGILERLNDRQSLDLLARRVRRRPHDVFEHSQIWQEICQASLRLLRAHADLPEGLETSTFSNIVHEDFLLKKEPLEKWMQAQDPATSPALDVLREVQELKKINSSLMKPGPIDDLIGDAYAYLFNNVGKQLWEDDQKAKQEEMARRPPPILSPPRNPMMSLNHLMNMDGSNDAATTKPTLSGTQTPATALDPGQSAGLDLAPARRKIGVGRREIRTCAETCLQRAQAATAPSGTRVQVVIDNTRSAAGDASADTSAPGSIHDSADDESELSELEEADEDEAEVKVTARSGLAQGLTFPGLADAVTPREESRDRADEKEDLSAIAPVAEEEVIEV